MRSILTAAAATLALTAAVPALAQTTAPTQSEGAGATAGPAALAVGMPVKDKTGVVVGQISELKPAPGGQQATVKMGDQSFSISTQSFVVQNGAAVLNATEAQLKAMVSSAKAG